MGAKQEENREGCLSTNLSWCAGFSSIIRANYFIFTEGVRKLFPSAVPLYQFSGILLSSVATSFWGTMAKTELSNEGH